MRVLPPRLGLAAFDMCLAGRRRTKRISPRRGRSGERRLLYLDIVTAPVDYDSSTFKLRGATQSMFSCCCRDEQSGKKRKRRS